MNVLAHALRKITGPVDVARVLHAFCYRCVSFHPVVEISDDKPIAVSNEGDAHSAVIICLL